MASPAPAPAPAPVQKPHPSPSKVSSTRTYDSKLVSREMHRLGNLTHLPAALAPALAAAASSTSLALPTPPSAAAATATADNPWGSLHVHVLPLFNGEPLRIPIEDLNTLVKRHIQSVVSLSPSKALATLEQDVVELIASGMVTLNAKLLGIDDDKLVHRVVEIWGFFWDQVLPYVEGVLLPLQTDSLLSSLYRTPKTHRPSSPTKGSISLSLTSSKSTTPQIDVRTTALRSFRDRIIYPLSSRLRARLGRQDSSAENVEYQQPRLQQMLLVLASQGGRQGPPALSLTAPAPQPTPSELAIAELLRTVRSPPKVSKNGVPAAVRAQGFLSGGLPRDRRGRIGQKTRQSGGWATAGELGAGEGEETPRNGGGGLAEERERERVFLEGLRSPDVDADMAAARASAGGWGLGAGVEDSGKGVEEDDEDEALDWDQAQAVVERMVGMKPSETARRLT